MRFKPEHSLHDYEDFKVAWGLWDGEDECLGMRWKGYPFDRSGDEAWLVIPENLELELIKSLLGKEGTKNDSIIQVLQKRI